MKSLLVFIIFISIFMSSWCKKDHYVAASMHLIDFSTPEEYVNYVDIAKSSHSAEIIVFPELSLGSGKDDGEIVTVNSTPCLDSSPESKPRQYALSCAARSNTMYVVLSLLEYDGNLIYNTAAVFDRTGTIITKYRKTHPLLPFVSPGESGSVYFTSDFGPTFGIFICFDILFKNPAEDLPELYNVTDFLYPTFWVEAPPMFALQTQQSFSEFFQVNIVASNNIDVNGALTSLGTGHFTKGRPLSWSMNRTQNQLLVSTFPILEPSPTFEVPNIPSEWDGPFQVQKWFEGEKKTDISDTQIETPYYSCNLSYRVSKAGGPQWYTFFALRDGPPKNSSSRDGFQGFVIYEDICGVYVCDDGNATSLQQCFNSSLDASSYFDFFQLSITLRDNVRSVRTFMAADQARLFEKPFIIEHKDTVHSVTLKDSSQSLLSASIVALLNDFK